MVELEINAEKTKVMRVQPFMGQPPVVTDSLQLEYVEDFRYRGQIVTSTGGASTDITRRIRSAGSAYGMLRNIWRFTSITKKVKVKVFNSNVLSVLLYGCETWRMTIGDARKLRAFHHRCLRRILKIRWFHKKSNAEVLKMANAKVIWREAETRRWRYLGHCLRCPKSIQHTSSS